MPVVVGGSVGAADGIDLLDYLRGDGRAYIVHHPDGNQEKFRTVRDGARWLQLKNSQWEEFWFTDSFIWRGVDVDFKRNPCACCEHDDVAFVVVVLTGNA